MLLGRPADRPIDFPATVSVWFPCMIEQSCSDWMFNQHLLANSGRVSLTQCQRQPAVAHYFQRSPQPVLLHICSHAQHQPLGGLCHESPSGPPLFNPHFPPRNASPIHEIRQHVRQYVLLMTLSVQDTRWVQV
jgi:hypothetical protein